MDGGPIATYSYAGYVPSGSNACVLPYDPVSRFEARRSQLQVIIETVVGDTRATDLLVSYDPVPNVSNDLRTGGGRRVIAGGQITRPTLPYICRFTGGTTLTLSFVDVDGVAANRTADTIILLTIREVFLD